MSTGTTTSTGVMEQAKYWMWMKRKIMMSEKPATYVHDHYNYSTTTTSSIFKQDDVESSNWEEQAFVEDSVGPLGSFIWPPRSYSCSFCGREFRSAQALGGHMNVHRRDRAKLKGSPSPTSSTTSPIYENKSLQHHDHHKRPYSSFNDDQVCKVVYNNISNPSFVSSLPLSTPKICEDTSTTLGSSRSCSSTSIVHHDDQEKQKGSLLSLDLHHPCGPCSDPVAVRVINLSSTTVSSGSKLKNSSRAHEIAGFEAKDEDNYINVKPAADSAVMNCLFANRRPTRLDSNEDGNKKRRQDYVSSLLPFSLKTGSVVDQCRHFHNKVPGLIPNSMEELDLELRLGDRPKR